MKMILAFTPVAMFKPEGMNFFNITNYVTNYVGIIISFKQIYWKSHMHITVSN